MSFFDFPKQFTKHILFVKVRFEGTKQRKKDEEKNNQKSSSVSLPTPFYNSGTYT